MRKLKTLALIVSAFLGWPFAPTPALALQQSLNVVRSKAFFIRDSRGLFLPLDLKQKTVRFQPSDFEVCGQKMKRQAGEKIYYSCVLKIPTSHAITRLREQVSPAILAIRFGGHDFPVKVDVSSDAAYVRFATSFDPTGLDKDLIQFNDEFHKVYAKVAQMVIAEAMTQQPLHLLVLEGDKTPRRPHLSKNSAR